jgi:ABC-type multidrug transport system ATPase subunit
VIWKAEHLSAGYNPTEGRVNNINFEFYPGERVAVLGGERSGSYMLLRVLCGLRPRRSGGLSLFGQPVAQLQFYDDWDHIFSRSLRNKLGVALEKDGLLANVSIREGFETVIRFGSHCLKQEVDARASVDHALELFGIGHLARFRPHQLSMSERRFAALARAVLLSPEVYVFEGATKGLDDRDRERLIYAFDKMFLPHPSRSLLVATEDWAFAMRYCPRVIVMDEGEVIFDGPWKLMPKECSTYWQKIAGSVQRRWELDAPLREVI